MRRIGLSLLLVIAVWAPAPVQAQSPAIARRLAGIAPHNRVTETVDGRYTVRVSGTVNPLVRRATDAGALPPDRVILGLQLVLRRDPVQEAALEAFLGDQQDPASPVYHQWLTPRTFGEHFGASQKDLDLTTAWLRSQGLSVDEVPAGRQSILFSGSAAHIQAAFHAELHAFTVDGATYFSNVTEQQIPRALTPILAGVLALNDFDRIPNPRLSAGLRPAYFTGSKFLMDPRDFATIYNLKPLYDNGITGAGQTIAVVGGCNIDPSVPDAFRVLEGLPPSPVTITDSRTDAGL